MKLRPDVTKERCGFRHLELSARHREWGINCPATDIDLILEIARGQPAALIEYKKSNADLEQSRQSWKTVWSLADRASLPFFLVLWHREADLWSFKIARANKLGVDLVRRHLGSSGEQPVMTEMQFVSFLYLVRDFDPEEVRRLPAFRSKP